MADPLQVTAQGLRTPALPWTAGRCHSLAAEIRTDETDSTITLMRLLDRLWRDRPEASCQLLQVGLVLTRLVGSPVSERRIKA